MEWTAPIHEFKQISDNVYYLTHGDHDRPAIGVIIGKEATLLIDAGNSNHHSSVVLGFLSKLSKERDVAPVRYVMLTHWHWDHSFGVVGYEIAYQDKDQPLVEYPVVIGHRLTTQELKKQKSYEFTEEALQERVNTGIEIEFIQKHMLMEYPDLIEIDIRTPKLSYEKRLEIDLGGIYVIVEHLECDHSPDSSLIYVKDIKDNSEFRVLFLGDVIYPNLYHGEIMTVNNVQRMIKKVRTFKADIFVDSHQKPWSANDFMYLISDYEKVSDFFANKFSNHEISNVWEEIEFKKRSSDLTPEFWKEFQIYIISSFHNKYSQ